MKLSVTGLDAATPIKFTHLWGRYVYGFKPMKHCLRCFVSNVAKGISPEMKDGSIILEDRLFYLCGVGKDVSEKLHPELARRFTNVHLAVRPRKGSVAAIGSVYGVTFVIEDAQAIPIETLPRGFRNLPDAHSQCKNFQFGFQMLKAGEFGEPVPDTVYALRDRWNSSPELTPMRP
jgi:hypothetical protein